MYSVQVSEQVNQIKMNFPTEVLEIIASYLDGKTLLNFKLVSKRCNYIVSYVQRCYKPWKKICHKEIPKPYFIDLISKHFCNCTDLDHFSEKQYQMIYKLWLQWQGMVFNVNCVTNYNFSSHDKIRKIYCQKLRADIVLQNLVCKLSLFKNEEKGKYSIFEPEELEISSTAIDYLLTPSYAESYRVSLKRIRSLNNCIINHPGYCDGPSRKLDYKDINSIINVELLIEESCYKCYYNGTQYYHHCKHLKNNLFVSVIHGVIIGKTTFNCIALHNICTGLCTKINSWLEPKYMSATAVYIYTNVLLVGTQNGYLLAYRLQCWDDLVNLKKYNMLFETQLGIGTIVNINILNYKNDKIVIVSSQSSLNWIKIN